MRRPEKPLHGALPPSSLIIAKRTSVEIPPQIFNAHRFLTRPERIERMHMQMHTIGNQIKIGNQPAVPGWSTCNFWLTSAWNSRVGTKLEFQIECSCVGVCEVVTVSGDSSSSRAASPSSTLNDPSDSSVSVATRNEALRTVRTQQRTILSTMLIAYGCKIKTF